MNNLIEIQSQIEKLQKKAIEIKKREFTKAVKEIRSMMTAFGITLKDLQPAKVAVKNAGSKGAGLKKRAAKRGAAAKTKESSSVPAKFRGPNGETWSGRGLMPRWLSALVAKGRTKEEFAVEGKPAAKRS